MTEDEARAHVAARVSRETFERLDLFAALLVKWQARVNLVANPTLLAMWQRHFLDSLQVLDLAPVDEGRWLDIGSGGGFPGLVCAIAATERAPGLSFELLDSDQRKCAFLREVARQTGTPVTIHATRIETLPSRQAHIVSARAVAPLPRLLGWAHRHVRHDGTCLLQKGAAYRDELESARSDWQMEVDAHPSLTASDSVILSIRALTHA